MNRAFFQAAAILLLALGVPACAQTGGHDNGGGPETCAYTGVSSDASGPDFLIRNAVLVDGTGAAAQTADIRIRDGIVQAIGTLCPEAEEPVLDAGGLIVSPGFVDTHSHHDIGMMEGEAARSMRAAVSQGVTTIIVGQDGMSVFPLAKLAEKLEEAPVAVNVASYTGHGTIRMNATGTDYKREVTSAEMERMKAQLQQDLDNGSLGLSTGLEYDPGIYSDSEEVIALARVLREHGGRYISHIRSEDRNLENAIGEIIRIGAETGIPVQISHFKIAYVDYWGRAAELLETLSRARAAGVDVTADAYPYDYWQSTLTVLLPDRDFSDIEAARYALEHLAPADGLTIVKFDANPALIGKTVQEIADARGVEPASAYLDLIQEAYAGLVMEEVIAAGVPRELVLGRSMSADDVKTIMLWPYTNISSDGTSFRGHPRGYGSFPRSIRWLVRDEAAIPLEEMIRKLTSLSASNVGLEGLGVLRPGAVADLVLFDADQITDHADIADPMAVSTGIVGVWVGGFRVWQDGDVTGAYPGRFLPRSE